jgi:hypothetical protein
MPMFIHTPGEDVRVLAAGDWTPLHARQEPSGLQCAELTILPREWAEMSPTPEVVTRFG